MKRPLVVFAILLAVAAGASALRLPRLAIRPMHGDEANQAVKAGILLETGVYRYDPRDHHGPTLYFLTLPSVWLSRARTFGETTEVTYRIVPALFGIGLVVLVWLIADGIGRAAAVCAAVLTAISPAMVFYSRYYIQEMLLVFFTFVVIASGWRYARTRRRGWLLAAGAFAGLMFATKETWVVAAAAMVVALAATLLWGRWVCRETVSLRPFLGGWRLVDGILAAGVVAVVLLSSFFTNARGPLDSVLAYGLYLTRAGGAGLHDNPGCFYLGMLADSRTVTGAAAGPWWSEGLILGLAAVGVVAALVRRGIGEEHVPLARFLAFYTVILTALYSMIPYKTPWCALGFLHGMVLMAGIGAVAVVRWFSTRRLCQGLVCLVLAALAAQLGWQAYRASFRFPADQRNPYVYAHTSPDALNLAQCVEDLAAVSPKGHEMIVKVITAENYWPLPWYLRRFNTDHVGYYRGMPDDPEADVMIVGVEVQDRIEGWLAGRYGERAAEVYNRQSLFALRPQVFMRVYVAQDLWNALMACRCAPKPQ
jgi:uncharacterized protein (TIGR03663 family)